GALDLSYLRCVQGMIVMAPKDEQELRDMLYTAVSYGKGPVAIRYPRANALGVPLRSGFQTLAIGKAETVRTGTDVAILAIGNMVPASLKAANLLVQDGIHAEVVNMRFVKPMDDAMIRTIAGRFDHVLTVEDNVIQGGFGSAVLESLARQGLTQISVKLLGLPDSFIDHGQPAELYQMVNLDGPGIAASTKEFLTTRHGKASFEFVST
ncbi:MAG: transketolase C-terminal domain-containing protein, partial [Bacteroidota bacterium]